MECVVLVVLNLKRKNHARILFTSFLSLVVCSFLFNLNTNKPLLMLHFSIHKVIIINSMLFTIWINDWFIFWITLFYCDFYFSFIYKSIILSSLLAYLVPGLLVVIHSVPPSLTNHYLTLVMKERTNLSHCKS